MGPASLVWLATCSGWTAWADDNATGFADSAGFALDTTDPVVYGFADSAGLRVIADTHRRLHEAGGALIVRHPSTSLEKLLAVTGLADHVTVESR